MALQDDVRTIAGLPAFCDLEPEAVRLIAFSAETRILRAGDVLFRQGEEADSGYVLLSGVIGLESVSHRAPTIVQAPALLGELALVAETRRAATATASEPSNVLKVPRTLYRRILTEYPDSAVRARATVAARLFAMRVELDGLRRSIET